MSSEIRVIVEDQDAGARPAFSPISRRGESAQSRADDDEIVDLGDRNPRRVEAHAVAQGMRGIERAGRASTGAGLSRGLDAGPRRRPGQQARGRDPRDDRQRHAVQKIAAGDAIHGVMLT